MTGSLGISLAVPGDVYTADSYVTGCKGGHGELHGYLFSMDALTHRDGNDDGVAANPAAQVC